MLPVKFTAKIIRPLVIIATNLQDLGYLAARFWIARVFFLSALAKISSWDTTLVLFRYDYHVPLISFVAAAYIGTGLELILPILLILGFGGRLAIFIFFIYNIVCVISFNFLWTPAGSSGFDDHVNWGLLLLLLFLHGPGRYSLDYLIHKKFGYLLNIDKELVQAFRNRKNL